MPSFLYSSPPSYDTVVKIDRTELPTYQQAVGADQPQETGQKVWENVKKCFAIMNLMWYITTIIFRYMYNVCTPERDQDLKSQL